MDTFSILRYLFKRVLNFLKNFKNSTLALIGLIVLFAFSMVMAGGGKPKLNNVESTLKKLSGNEIKTIVTPIPTDALTPPMVKYSGLDKDMSREEIINSLKLSEIKDIPLLERFFPNFHFLKGIDWGVQSEIIPVYLTAIIGNKLFDMPNGFNRLLVESGIEINDKNIIELAKAFVILALGSETVLREDGTWDEELALFPQITFLEGKRIKNFKEAKKINKNYQKLMVTDFTYRAYLKIKIGQETQEWYFGVNPQDTGQFGVVNIGIPAKSEFHLRYNLFQGETKSKGKSWDTNPQIHVDSVLGGVYLEKCGDTLRYYLIVSENGEIRGHFPYFSVFFSQII